MKLLSNIIKSFRVIEKSIITEEKPDNNTSLDEVFVEEARQKYDEIVLNAEKKAKKIINSAYSDSEEKLNNAYERSKKIFKEAEAKGYKEGFELGIENGFNEGHEKGYKEGKDDSEKLITEALEIKNDYIEQKSKLLRESEEELIELIISIYEKVLYKNVKEDEELIVSLVLSGIDNLEISDKLTIIVCQDDYPVIEKSKDII